MKHLLVVTALTLTVILPATAQNKPSGGGTTVGVITIDQAKAEAGGITPGDAPGFPVTISQPGSYRLMGNLTVADMATTGIVITSPGVTLDFNGFELRGPNTCVNNGTAWVSQCASDSLGSGTRGLGVHLLLPAGSPASVAIGNGSVRGFAHYGMRAEGGLQVFTVDQMRVSHSGYAGIAFAAMVTRSVVDSNKTVGIHHSHGVVGNTISRNGGMPLWNTYARHNTLVANGATAESVSLID